MEKNTTSQEEKKNNKEKGRNRCGAEKQKIVHLLDGNNLRLAQEAADHHKQFQKRQVFILKNRLHFSMLAKLLINKCFHMTLDLLESFQEKGKLNHLSAACGTQRNQESQSQFLLQPLQTPKIIASKPSWFSPEVTFNLN